LTLPEDGHDVTVVAGYAAKKGAVTITTLVIKGK